MADSDFISEKDIPKEWTPVVQGPRAAPPPYGASPDYFQGTIASTLQHDAVLYETRYKSAGIPVTPLMPIGVGATAQVNAGSQSVVKNSFNRFVQQVIAAQPVATPDFNVTISPQAQTILQAGSANYVVTLTPLNGFATDVGFSVTGLPAEASYSFTPPTVTTSGDTTLAITTTGSIAAGTYTCQVVALGGGFQLLQHSTTFLLSVTATGSADFTVSASPTSRAVLRGEIASYTITITAQGGFGGVVSFATSGMPGGGATATYTPTTVTGSGTTTLDIDTASAAAGTYHPVIIATSGALQHTTSVTLRIFSEPGGGP